MRIARVLSGILLVAVAVMALLGSGALWMAMRHASPDGGFGGSMTGLATAGDAIVVPDVDALLRADASVTGRSGTSVSIDAVTTTGPAFIGLAPIHAIRAYLGPVSYGRVTSLHTGSGGMSVTVEQVRGAATSNLNRGNPATQGFWAAASAAGRIEWTPSDPTYDDLALVIMRPDGGGPVAATARAEVRVDWLAATTWALLSVGTVGAILAIVLLMWPVRRREIVYVVTPAELPEIAGRLGLPLDPSPTPADVELSSPHESRPAEHIVPTQAVEPPPRTERAADAHLARTGPESAAGKRPAWAGPTLWPAATIRASVPMDRPGTGPPMPGIFADPARRPDSLRAAMLLTPVAGIMPAPLPTNEPGMYRSFGMPPPVSPAFLWTPTTDARV